MLHFKDVCLLHFVHWLLQAIGQLTTDLQTLSLLTRVAFGNKSNILNVLSKEVKVQRLVGS